METICTVLGVVVYFGIGLGMVSYLLEKEKTKEKETENEAGAGPLMVIIWPIVLIALLVSSLLRLISPIKKKTE